MALSYQFSTLSTQEPFLQAWERKMTDEFKHPTFGYRCSYRRAIELQARLLSRHLQEDVPYKPWHCDEYVILPDHLWFTG